jgi:hypothetical protein
VRLLTLRLNCKWHTRLSHLRHHCGTPSGSTTASQRYPMYHRREPHSSIDTTLAARHPVIAREVVTHYRRSGQLGQAIARLAFVMATKVYPGMPRTAERRLLTTLTNHEFLLRSVDTTSNIRDVYSEIETLLHDDAHYWLQRGSFELERGDIVHAENFLAQARGMAAGDHMIDTEWAYLLMEKACRDPGNTRAVDWFQEALAIIYDVIDAHPADSPNTYVVLAQHVDQWVQAAPIRQEERLALLQSTRAVLDEGARHYAGNNQVERARQDIERAYLNQAVVRE